MNDQRIFQASGNYAAGTELLSSGSELLVLFQSNDYYNESKYKNCCCSTCRNKLKNHYKKFKSSKLNYKLYVMILLVISISFWLVETYNEIIMNDGKLKNYSPYDILGIPRNATLREIRKAYR